MGRRIPWFAGLSELERDLVCWSLSDTTGLKQAAEKCRFEKKAALSGSSRFHYTVMYGLKAVPFREASFSAAFEAAVGRSWVVLVILRQG
jgi:hypothetical protein